VRRVNRNGVGPRHRGYSHDRQKRVQGHYLSGAKPGAAGHPILHRADQNFLPLAYSGVLSRRGFAQPQRTDLLTALDVILDRIIEVAGIGGRRDCIQPVGQDRAQTIAYAIRIRRGR